MTWCFPLLFCHAPPPPLFFSFLLFLLLPLYLLDELAPGSPNQKKDAQEQPELRPFSKPELAFTQSFKLLSSDDWWVPSASQTHSPLCQIWWLNEPDEQWCNSYSWRTYSTKLQWFAVDIVAVCVFREKKIEGLTFLRCLALYHSDVLSSRLHDVCLALIQEVTFPLRVYMNTVVFGSILGPFPKWLTCDRIWQGTRCPTETEDCGECML